MIVNHKARWVFFCEPHTASRACQIALPKCFPDAEPIGAHHDGPDKLPPECEDYTFVTTVRNPFETLMTKRWGAATRREPVESYLERMWNHDHLKPCYGFCFRCQRIVYYEHLVEDLRTIFGNKSLGLKHDYRHASPNKPKWHEHIPREWIMRYGQRQDVVWYMAAFGYFIDYDTGKVEIGSRFREAYVYPVGAVV